MKKLTTTILIIILSLLMVFAFAACENGYNNGNDTGTGNGGGTEQGGNGETEITVTLEEALAAFETKGFEVSILGQEGQEDLILMGLLRSYIIAGFPRESSYAGFGYYFVAFVFEFDNSDNAAAVAIYAAERNVGAIDFMYIYLNENIMWQLIHFGEQGRDGVATAREIIGGTRVFPI